MADLLTQREVEALLAGTEFEYLTTQPTIKEEPSMTKVNVITLRYTTPVFVHNGIGFELRFHYTNAPYQVFDVLEDDFILCDSVLINEKPWDSKKAVKMFKNYKHLDESMLETIYIENQRSPELISLKYDVKESPVYNYPSELKAVSMTKGVTASNPVQTFTVPAEVIEIIGAPITVNETKEEIVMTNPTPVVNVEEAIAKAIAATASQYEAQITQMMEMNKTLQAQLLAKPVVVEVTKEEPVMTNTKSPIAEMAEAMGITEEEILEASAAITDAKLKEFFEFLQKEGGLALTDDEIAEALKNEDADSLAEWLKVAAMSCNMKKPGNFEKAKVFAGIGVDKVKGLFTWAKGKSGNVLSFIWDSVKYVASVSLSIVVATVKFSFDVLNIVAAGVCAMAEAIGSSFVEHYSPIYNKVGADLNALTTR